MKIQVDIKKAVQELNLDTGNHVNYLVFEVAGQEITVAATDEQVAEAVCEASLADQEVPHQEMPVGPPYASVAEEPAPSHVGVDFAELGAVGEIHDEMARTMLTSDAPPEGDLVGFILPDEGQQLSAVQQREANIKQTRSSRQPPWPKPAVLAARALSDINQRRGAPSDEAGNPLVPQRVSPPVQERPVETSVAPPPMFDEDGIVPG